MKPAAIQVREATLILMLGSAAAAPAAAGVVDVSTNGFTVQISTHIAAAPAKVYAALIDPARWWSSEHTFSGSAANLHLDAKAGGCWCETLPNGGSVVHLIVVYVDPGKAHLQLLLDQGSQTIQFKLTYSGLSAPVTQSHIHFGKVHVAGGVMVFFCSNLTTAPPGVQPCPAGGGTVTGTITAANVLAVAGQNITAGDFDALTDALTSNTAYANIHTAAFPAGEIRGEIRKGGNDHDD